MGLNDPAGLVGEQGAAQDAGDAGGGADLGVGAV